MDEDGKQHCLQLDALGGNLTMCPPSRTLWKKPFFPIQFDQEQI